MKGYISESIADAVDWEEKETSPSAVITAKIEIQNKTIEGKFLKITFGKRRVLKISLANLDAEPLIFGEKLLSVKLTSNKKSMDFELKNPNITINREFGDNYTLTIED